MTGDRLIRTLELNKWAYYTSNPHMQVEKHISVETNRQHLVITRNLYIQENPSILQDQETLFDRISRGKEPRVTEGVSLPGTFEYVTNDHHFIRSLSYVV